MPRPGYERFTDPTAAAHRRHEALRAYFENDDLRWPHRDGGELTYFVEARSASEIAERFGYSKASVQTLVSLAGGARRLMDFPVRSH
jgi:hypothetical protein